ncbi:TPA: hypothetical protein ACIYZ6_004928 [Escherichia coli]|nr:hypothetical protein [Escherichia coli]
MVFTTSAKYSAAPPDWAALPPASPCTAAVAACIVPSGTKTIYRYYTLAAPHPAL